MDTIYQDIAVRTGGNVYIGVVGPVRTGKSTLIKRIMEQLVIPQIPDPHRQERARDELPQSGSGKTIMTSEPKFVPEEAAEISPDGTARLRVRFIDSVGYMVPGAVGAEEEGNVRMVTTPWYDHEIPMTQAAELGTKKVMQQHCSIGLVVTTDGSITDIPRQEYAQAERHAIRDMQATGKPFLVVINSRNPAGEAARQAKKQIQEEFGICPMVADCQGMTLEDIGSLLRSVLYTFPMTKLEVRLPGWMNVLEPEHPVKAELYRGLLQKAEAISNLGQAEAQLAGLGELQQVCGVCVDGVDPARKIRIGNKLYFGEDDSMVAEVIDNTTSRGRTLRFLYDGDHNEFKKALYALGETPLPKYIDRPVEPEDEDRYQNIFATEEGAVVAPAAGLHFSRELMKRLEIRDCKFAYLTLHSGLGNFREIDVEDLTKHKMDSEQMVVNADIVKTVNQAKDNGNRVCAVGTSVMRAIETAVSTDGHLKEFEGWTNKFIFPPYDFGVATSMVTNFHLPLSTMLMMTASFGGYDLIMDAYDIALKEKYNFGAYGDAMLIL